MISYLRGKIRHKNEKYIILDVNGVGYQVFVPFLILEKMKEGGEAELFTSLCVRQETMELYGFSNLRELEFFQQLVAISGVGPKSALGVLSVGKLEDIKGAIVSESPNLLMRVSGIGKKTAERIIVELKSKIAKEGDYGMAGKEGAGSDADIIDALIGLGYSAAQAREAVRQVPKETEETEERLREALKRIK